MNPRTSHSTITRSIVRRRHRAALSLALIVALAASGLAPRAARAERPATPSGARWEFLMSSGAVVPTGAQRDVLANGGLSSAQLFFVVRPALAIAATAAWARSRDLRAAGEPALDLLSYDLGAEARAPRLFAGSAFAIRPFVGFGAGARSYNHRHADRPVAHDLAAYGGAGAEVGSGRLRVRIEARDHVVAFSALGGGDGSASTRNELALMAGLRLVSR